MKSPAKKHPKQLLAVQVSSALVAAVDTIAERKFQSRSEVVRQALLAALEKEGVVPLNLVAA
jgi:metal-responsive CopG/Arc/MetJ family transcriptional regulator